MKNHDKTRTQLVNELVILRKEIAEFKLSEAQRKKAEDSLVECEEKFRTFMESASD